MAAIRTWSEEDNYKLTRNWNKKTVPQLAEMLQCDESTIRRHARKLREIGVDLPERQRTNHAPPITAEEKSAAKPASKEKGYWSDGWRITPPSLAQLRAGR